MPWFRNIRLNDDDIDRYLESGETTSNVVQLTGPTSGVARRQFSRPDRSYQAVIPGEVPSTSVGEVRYSSAQVAPTSPTSGVARRQPSQPDRPNQVVTPGEVPSTPGGDMRYSSDLTEPYHPSFYDLVADRDSRPRNTVTNPRTYEYPTNYLPQSYNQPPVPPRDSIYKSSSVASDDTYNKPSSVSSDDTLAPGADTSGDAPLAGEGAGDFYDIEFGTTGPLRSRLFGPITSALGRERELLAEELAEFAPYEEDYLAGTDLGDFLTDYIETGEGRDQVEEWLSTAFDAPGWDYETNPELVDFINALSTPGGIRTAIRDVTPGLTPGMQRQESRLLWEDPGVQGEMSGLQTDFEQFLEDVTRDKNRAEELTQKRREEIAETSEESESILTDYYNEMLTDIEERERAEQEAWDQEAAEIKELTPEEAIAAEGDTTIGRSRKEAEDLWNEIFDRYYDISYIPSAQLGLDHEGREQTFFYCCGAWHNLEVGAMGRLEDLGYPPGPQTTHLENIARRVMQRQIELEYHFAPHHPRTDVPAENQWWGDIPRFGGRVGEYAAYKPLYFAPALGVGNTQMAQEAGLIWPSGQQYLQFSPGIEPTLQSVTTPEEVLYSQRIAELLDLPELVGSTQPHSLPGYTFNMADYTEAEKIALENRLRAIEDAAAQWAGLQNYIRSEWKDDAEWDQIMGLLPAALPTPDPSGVSVGAIAFGDSRRPLWFADWLEAPRVLDHTGALLLPNQVYYPVTGMDYNPITGEGFRPPTPARDDEGEFREVPDPRPLPGQLYPGGFVYA